MKQSKQIYDLMYKRLKEKLSDPECSPQIIKIALDFCRQYELDVEVVARDQDRSIGKLLETLPFKKVD